MRLIFSIFAPLGTGEHPSVPSFRFFGAGEHPNARSFRFLADVSIFFIFFCSGRRKGESGAARKGGVDFLLKAPEGGGSLGGVEGSGGCLRRIGDLGGGGGLNIFFRGRNVHQIASLINEAASH